MIQAKLWARLGNQCWQISAGIGMAKRMGTTYAFPKHSLDPRIWPTYFTLPIAKRATRHYYKEPRHAYDPLPLNDDMTIEGYFQSERYFAEAKQEVAKALGFSQPHRYDHVAIHVRRGDYLQYPDQFPVLTSDYYIPAIQRAAAEGYKRFKVYSDDIKWCREEFRQPAPWANDLQFEFSIERDPLKDLHDMHLANAFIIANSSYSLFAASLRDDNPLVIAPAEDRWYGPANKHMETCDLMNENWIKI